jgi:hypothetical protein
MLSLGSIQKRELGMGNKFYQGWIAKKLMSHQINNIREMSFMDIYFGIKPTK